MAFVLWSFLNLRIRYRQLDCENIHGISIIHSLNLTAKTPSQNERIVFQPSIFTGYGSFTNCKWSFNLEVSSLKNFHVRYQDALQAAHCMLTTVTRLSGGKNIWVYKILSQLKDEIQGISFTSIDTIPTNPVTLSKGDWAVQSPPQYSI